MELSVLRGPARSRPACHNPARPIANIFVTTGDIGGLGRGRKSKGRRERPQEPMIRQRGG